MSIEETRQRILELDPVNSQCWPVDESKWSYEQVVAASRSRLLSRLILEVQAKMPCYTLIDPCVWTWFGGSGGLAPWSIACPPCVARAKLKELAPT